MPGGTLATLAADTKFPALGKAIHLPTMQAVLSELMPQVTRQRILWFEILNHKAGRRCTLRYHLESGSRRFDVVAKWQKELRNAERLRERLVWARGVGLEVPEPLGFLSGDGLVLQEMVHGTELRHMVSLEDEAPFEAAGRWLAGLHSEEVPSFLSQKTLARELTKAEGWSTQVLAKLPDLRNRLEKTTVGLRKKSESLELQTVPIHRDYYPANLVWDGQRLIALDFDQMASGDPGVDLGAFLAQVDKLVIRDRLASEAVGRLKTAFLNAYLALRPLTLEPRLSFFHAYTMLKLAAGEVRRERVNWRELTGHYVALAEEQAIRLA